MRIAVIGDVHANLPALDAVLADARRRGAQQIWNIGDTVGYGAFPDQVVQRLARLGALNILGNYDRKVLKFPQKRSKWQRTKAPAKFTAFRWAWQQLSAESKALLESLPRRKRLDIEGWRVVVTHGTIEDDQEGIDETTPIGRLRELAGKARADLIVSGHTHRPFDTSVDGVQFVSVPSVGRPEGDTRAGWCLLNIEESRLEIEHRQVPYDIDKAVEALERHQLPEEFSQMLRRGMNLDQVILARAGQAIAPADGGDRSRLDQAVEQLGRQCHFDQPHAEKVTELALMLFDQLQPLHQLGPGQRDLLWAAGMLHDIGWIGGKKRHHKRSRDLILAAKSLGIAKPDRRRIAAIARYHRRALPCSSHKLFGSFRQADRQLVSLAGGMLRLADGLDRSHAGAVRDLQCRASAGQILIRCFVEGQAEAELQAAAKKSDLLARALNREIRFERLDAVPAAGAGWQVGAPGWPGPGGSSITL